VRTISEQSLAWNTINQERTPTLWVADLISAIDLQWNRDPSRSSIFKLNEDNRRAAWRVLNKVFRENPDVYKQFGLLPDVPRYDHQGKAIRQPPPGATTFEVHSVRPARRPAPDGSFHTDIVAIITQRQPKPIRAGDPSGGWFWFRGGATLIIDSRTYGLRKNEQIQERIRYTVVKNSGSESRLARQRQAMSSEMMPALRALYFGKTGSEPFAMMHAGE
jgi:hypothetical protein